ncbi:PROF2 protein, partial [Polyodon spathula]|nr:PROF2 protein [Polyodon spathula]
MLRISMSNLSHKLIPKDTKRFSKGGARVELSGSKLPISSGAASLGNRRTFRATVLPVLHIQILKEEPEEIAVLIGKDRTSFLTNGLTLGKVKCSVLRDRLDVEDEWTVDLRTKAPGEPTYNISVAKAGKGRVNSLN